MNSSVPPVKVDIDYPIKNYVLDMQTPHMETVQKFIKEHDTVGSNITELSNQTLNRLKRGQTMVSLAFDQEMLIGCMFSIVFRVTDNNNTFYTSYTTFLCVHRDYRSKNTALALIRDVMNNGYQLWGVNHGYYMSLIPRMVGCTIKSWFRPIKLNKMLAAGFQLHNPDKSGKSGIRQQLYYKVSKPSNLPIKNGIWKCTSGFHLSPTEAEWKMLCQVFDVYSCQAGCFMLFPMTTYITSSKRRITNAQVVLACGDVLKEVVYTASQLGYDGLYGWCCGDVTEEKVKAIHGSITAAETRLEYHNYKEAVSVDKFYAPLF